MTAKTEPQEQPISCCSAFYEQDWVRQLAEDIFHPGGEELTKRTIAAMNLPERAAVADLGCGTGTTALLLARDHGLRVSAVDLSAANIERAMERSAAAGSTGIPVRFIRADACHLPYDDNELDGTIIECTFSLFADKPAVLAEIRRVLKPGGKLAITDMAIGGPLPGDIADIVAPWTCLDDAQDQQAYAKSFAAAGFEIQDIADESAGLTTLIHQLKRKLLLAGTGAILAEGSMPGFKLDTVKIWLDRLMAEVDQGMIRYLRFQLRNLPAS